MTSPPMTRKHQSGAPTGTPSTPDGTTSGEAHCTACSGFGLVSMPLEDNGSSFYVSSVVPCPVCGGRAYIQRDPLFKALQSKTFATFDGDVKGVRRACQLAKLYAASPEGWLILTGIPGCGKTHLAAAVCHELAQQGKRPRFTVVPDLLEELRAGFNAQGSNSYDSLSARIRSAEFLVLDDLGTENNTVWAREKVFQIVNYRYNHQLPLIITSNRTADAIDPRIVSRASELAFRNEILHIDADDYRTRQTKGRW